jgi:hypothetical protein
VHRCAESAPSIRGKGHEPPLTVLADDELPVLADPVDSEDDPVLEVDEEDEDDEDDGVGVLAVAEDDITALLAVLDVPACVCAASSASAATAAVPTTPKDVVSLPRRRSARSRSTAVMRRFGAVPRSFMTSSVARAA